VINIDWSVYLRLRRNRVTRKLAPLFLKGERLARFRSLSDNILVHNLAKGIPFPSDSLDAVYHSHMLEHLDRDVARAFMLEIKRVLKPGGLQRVVVPDLEKACKAYLSHISDCEANADEANEHDRYVAAILEQCVRREASGTSTQRPIRRSVENLLLGDARRRGETHQWMYDRFNLGTLLKSTGYRDVRIQSYDESLIPDWNRYGLDQDGRGGEYKADSLYLEATKT
jgi:SAM-dependent methyltransferase